MLKSLLISIPLLAFVSCDGTSGAKKDSSGTLNLVSLNKPSVDASQLHVYNISVAKVKQGELWLGSLSYEADGQADIVEYKACHENGSCFNGKAAVNRVLMPAFPGGEVTLTAHACVDPGRSTSASNCGADATGTFLQPANADTRLTELSSQRTQKLEQMRNFGAAVKATLDKFQKDSDVCLKNDTQNQKILGKKKMVGAFTAMGQALIGVAMTYAVKAEKTQDAADIKTAQAELDPKFKGTPSERTKELQAANAVVPKLEIATAQAELDPNFVGPVSPRTLELEKAGIVNKSDLTKVFTGNEEGAKDLSTFKNYSGVVANSFGSVGLYQTNPVSSIQSMAMSMFDLFNADDVKLSPCLAEQVGQTEMNALKAQMKDLQAQIVSLDAILQPTQTGVVLP